MKRILVSALYSVLGLSSLMAQIIPDMWTHVSEVRDWEELSRDLACLTGWRSRDRMP